MEFEKLAVEVGALKAGLTAVTPHVLQGGSGVEHKFDMLFSDGARNYAFDFYDTVTDIEVVKSYAKKFDSGCSVSIISPAGSVTDAAKELALSYNMRLLTPEAASTVFALEKAALRRTFG
ncbi:MAG: hypothetical protein KGI26_06495 [Thaumarchaeota archaeon]|nr:hypothetical protein [Nitrososphaerota archaeon]